jgi:hypothetical protein
LLLPRVLGTVTLLLAGCASDAAPPAYAPSIETLPTPAGAPAGEPFLTTKADGTPLLSWLEAMPDSSVALRFAGWTGAQWSEPRSIVQRRDLFVNWADFPSLIALPDGRLAAHWLQREGAGTYAYGVRIAFSEDDGRTWSAPITPHTDGTHTEHGFVSLFPDGDALGAVWLDGRNMQGGDGHGAGDMTIRFARVHADGTLSHETELDARTCECCQTDVALARSGPVIVYRDRSGEEVRDIVIIRRVGDTWTAPAPVHADQWTIAGCPVNGPAVVADGDRVAVAWFAAPDDQPQVKVVFSADGGSTFGAPVRIDHGSPVGRVDLQHLPDGAVAVNWIERTAEGAAVRVRRVAADGSLEPAADVARSSAERASGFPRMLQTMDGLLFAWTQPGQPATIQLARVGLPGVTQQ